jgi:hypothetical protein
MRISKQRGPGKYLLDWNSDGPSAKVFTTSWEGHMGLQEEGKKKEEQWFRENEQKLIEDIRIKRLERIKKETEREEAARREELKQLHWMCCPKCGHAMGTQDIGGIEVDVCTLCEGIFFDRGELEQLLMKQSHSKQGFFRKLLGLGDE